MDIKKLQAFFDSAASVVYQMFGINATANNPIILSDDDKHGWEISGFIGIVGAYHGLMAVRFKEDMIDSLVKASGVITNSDKDKSDTATGLVAEMTNIIAGNAISSYTEYNLDIAPPLVIKGLNHKISWPSIAPVVAANFSTEFGNFELCVCFNIV